jgi:hypothetical protein
MSIKAKCMMQYDLVKMKMKTDIQNLLVNISLSDALILWLWEKNSLKRSAI